MARVLLVDDEPAVLGLLTPLLESMGHRPVPATTGEEAVRLAESIPFEAGVFDLRLPGMTGYDAFRLIQALQPRLVAVAITGIHPDDAEPLALAAGFVSLLPKPIRRDALSAALTLLLSKVPPPSAPPGFDGIVGASPRMREVFDLIPRIAATSETVLIRGETGTGKELVAQAIHRHSPRAGKPFETVDCGRGPETLLEAELFGHERGAFTDAAQRVVGWFEKADGGTLFLDEVGELLPTAQAKAAGRARTARDHAAGRTGSDSG
jgi:DNA-binding NtrC family response regulator